MALEYNITKVDKDKYPHGKDGKLNPITDALIWMTVYVEMGVPARDKEEWVRRVTIYEKVFGPHLVQRDENGEWEPCALTEQEIKDHAGMHTNAPNSTKYLFNKKVMEWLTNPASKEKTKA